MLEGAKYPGGSRVFCSNTNKMINWELKYEMHGSIKNVLNSESNMQPSNVKISAHQLVVL